MDFLKDSDKLILKGIQVVPISTYPEFVGSNYANIWTEIIVINRNTGVLDTITEEKYTTLQGKGFITPVYAGSTYYNQTVAVDSLIINTPEILKDIGYISGEYTVIYRFYYNLLGDNEINNRVFIKKISSSRKELLLDYVNESLAKDFTTLSRTHFWQYGRDFRFNRFLNFGNNVLSNIVNVKNEYIDSLKENRLIIKLYDRLPTSISERDTLWVVELITDDFIQDVTLLLDEPEEYINILRRPNYKIIHNSSDASGFQNFDNLLPNIKAVQDLNAADTNRNEDSSVYVDYSQFSNFTRFGSVTNKLENFKEKVILISQYDAELLKYTGSVGFAASSSKYIQDKRDEVFSKLTNYERFLYYETYTTASLRNSFTSALFPEATISAVWPKLTTDPTISLQPWDENPTSEVNQWFSTMSVCSLDYDANNKDFLINTLPTYIQYDTETNNDYISLLSSVGEVYDYIYTYIKGLENLYVRGNNSKTDGVPNEIIWNLLQNEGFTVINGSDLIDLSQYKYGLKTISTSSLQKLDQAEKDITQEIWNRLLNNYMYLYKNKGTEKSIYSLLNCFGIPSDVVQIREFGGPFTSQDNKLYEQTFIDFTHVVQMNSNEYIKIPWIKSSHYGRYADTIEMKFKTTSTLKSMSLFEIVSEENSGYGLKVNVNKIQNNYGFISLDFYTPLDTVTITGSQFPLYEGEYYNIMLQRDIESDDINIEQSYFINLIKYDPYINKITINESNYITFPSGGDVHNYCYSSSGSLYLGGYNDTRFEGFLDEFRLWNEVLDQNIFEWHSQYSTATNGNELTSSVETLQFRLSFNYPYNLYYTSSIANDAFDPSYAESASAFNFSSASKYDTYPYHFDYYERNNLIQHKFITPTSYNSNKVRIETNDITQIIRLPDGEVVKPLRSKDYYAIKAYPLIGNDNGNYVFSHHTSAIQIQGDVGEYDNADPDSDRLLIGFSPTEFINNDIIAFYGTENLSNAYGDYEYVYQDSYVDDNYTKMFYYQNTQLDFDMNKYIKYISQYNKTLFDTIKQFIPVKSTPIIGIVYEENLLHRNKISLMKNYNFKWTQTPKTEIDCSFDFIEIKAPNLIKLSSFFTKETVSIKAKSIRFDAKIMDVSFDIVANDINLKSNINVQKDFHMGASMYNPVIVYDIKQNEKIYAKDLQLKSEPINVEKDITLNFRYKKLDIIMKNLDEDITIVPKFLDKKTTLKTYENTEIFANLDNKKTELDLVKDLDVVKYRDSVITYINHNNQEIVLGRMLDYRYKRTLIDRMRRDFSVKDKNHYTYRKDKLDANEYNFQGYDDFFWKNTVNTSKDTPDTTPVIQTWRNNPNTLKVNYSDNPKLIVE